MSRRCLQFEQAQQETTKDGTYSPNPAINLFGSISPASSTELEILDSSQVELTISSHKEQTMSAMFCANISGKCPVAVSKPSGIGLHLNSIVNTLPMGSGASGPIMSHHLVENKISCSKLSNLVERVSLTAGDGVLQTKASLATSSTTSESFHNMESFNNLQPPEHQVTPPNKRRFSSEHAGNFEEFSPSSPKKKRHVYVIIFIVNFCSLSLSMFSKLSCTTELLMISRKKASSTDGDGCKRCNCRKTKCLKL
jgi:hypothetical protein